MSSKPPLPDLSKGFFDNPPALLSLAQARRDALCVALGYCDATEVWVALFDFAMTINAMSDWVRNARPDLERQTRELARNPEMGAWRDIANAGKHVKLDRAYSVIAIERTEAIGSGTLNAAGQPEQRLWRLRVKLVNDAAPYIEELAEAVLGQWEEFFQRYQID
jgi:hypothetical protein